MTSPDGKPVLTAAAMRAAEDAAMAAGDGVDAMMARAGAAVAEQVRRLASGGEVLILCGPGNNGGDGYVAARALKAAGVSVRVAASEKPKSEAAKLSRAGWDGPVEVLAQAEPAPVLVDALFGTGLTRPLNPSPADAGAQLHRPGDWAPAFAGEGIGYSLHALASAARLRIAVDLPSGVATDDGAILTEPPRFDVTLALGAAKPSHVLQPAARYCGAVRVLDIGVPVASDIHVLASPALADPGPDSHKYSRGMVAVIAGAMPGAAALAATAAARAGAGYVLLLGSATDRLPHAIVRRRYDSAAPDDPRIGALLIGPGLGREDDARERLDAALATSRPLVIDGDALHLLDLARLEERRFPAILTPHAGEFDALFGKGEGSKIDRARAAAMACGAIVVFKGADTVIAAPGGQVRIAASASDWLSTAGTGDVLAGAIGACLAAGLAPIDAAAAGLWLHADAARRCGASFIADDLAHALSAARASL